MIQNFPCAAGWCRWPASDIAIAKSLDGNTVEHLPYPWLLYTKFSFSCGHVIDSYGTYDRQLRQSSGLAQTACLVALPATRCIWKSHDVFLPNRTPAVPAPDSARHLSFLICLPIEAFVKAVDVKARHQALPLLLPLLRHGVVHFRLYPHPATAEAVQGITSMSCWMEFAYGC